MMNFEQDMQLGILVTGFLNYYTRDEIPDSITTPQVLKAWKIVTSGFMKHQSTESIYRRLTEEFGSSFIEDSYFTSWWEVATTFQEYLESLIDG